MTFTLEKIGRWLWLRLLAWLGYLCLRRQSEPAPLQRLLLIKPDHLGDVLLITPALRQLRQQHPQAWIVALVGPWSATILTHNPDIDTLITVPFPGFERRDAPDTPAQSLLAAIHTRMWAPVRPYLTLVHYALLLRAGQFDTALVLRDDHWWGAALALLAGIPRRIGYAVPACQPFLSTALPWQPTTHVSQQALTLCAATGGTPQYQSQEMTTLRYEPATTAMEWATTWLAAQSIGPATCLVMLHPGTGGATKLWSPERWAAVADALQARPDVCLVLTGGPGEAHLVQAIVAEMRHSPRTLVGQTSIDQLAALFRQAALVLGVDSGPLHLAVSQNVPTLHLFGPSAVERFGPWGNPRQHVVLRANLWCSPCGVFHACPRRTDPPECMEQLTVTTVVQNAEQLLATRVSQ